MKRLLLSLTSAFALTALAAEAHPAHHHRNTNVIVVPPGGFGIGGAPGAGDVANPSGVNGSYPGSIGNAIGSTGGTGDVASPVGGSYPSSIGNAVGSTGGMGDAANSSGSIGGGAGDVAGGGLGDVANPSHPVLVGGSHTLYPLQPSHGSGKHGHKLVGLTGATGKTYGALPVGSSGRATSDKGGHSGVHHHIIASAPHIPGKASSTPAPRAVSNATPSHGSRRASQHPGGAN